LIQPFQGWSVLDLPRVGVATPTLGYMIPILSGLAEESATIMDYPTIKKFR
jgi:hypothetical protein